MLRSGIAASRPGNHDRLHQNNDKAGVGFYLELTNDAESSFLASAQAQGADLPDFGPYNLKRVTVLPRPCSVGAGAVPASKALLLLTLLAPLLVSGAAACRTRGQP